MVNGVDPAVAGGLAAIILALGTFAFIIMLAFYIYFALALMTMAKKLNMKYPWLAWIPIANFYLMVQMVGWPWWATFAILLPIIPIVGGLALTVVAVIIWWKIAEKLNRPGWFSLLLLIPIVNLVILGVLAWGDAGKHKTK